MGSVHRKRSMSGKVIVALIRLYQRYLSPLLPPSCRFTPSCSQYTIEAISRYGLLRGSLMGAWSVLRCHPFSKGGWDPVK